MRWIFLLFLNLVIYEKRFPIVAFLNSFFYKKKKWRATVLDSIEVHSNKKIIGDKKIDVIIPTIGRKIYLYDVLKDLAQQTHLPINVIIVEQNPEPNSQSELDYIDNEVWPFKIKHTFTNQPGACNARNIALSQVESEWVFLNDDDNRFEKNLLKDILIYIEKYSVSALMTNYLQLNEKQEYNTIIQSTIFGSGNSIISSELLNKTSFDKNMEFGYGEDTDFGLQLRNIGIDIIYFPKLIILHLKAPMGGFRIKPILDWDKAKTAPKPSPTIMYVKQKYNTLEQINNYKTGLFLKSLKNTAWKNKIQLLLSFQKKWNASIYWSNQLKLNK